MEQWKAVLTCVFGGKSRRRWKMVAFDIMSVDIGIKNAYLFDQWSCSKEEACSLLANLHKQQLIHSKLGVLSVGLDILICSVQLCQFPILPIMPLLVDISSSLEKPLFVDNVNVMGKHLATIEAFQNFCQFMKQEKENDSLTSVSVPEFEIEVKNVINPPCLFGLALGYPFIYWFNREKDDESCLSMQTLRLYQVKGRERNDEDLIHRNGCNNTKSLQKVKVEHSQMQETNCSFLELDSFEQKNVSSFPSGTNQNADFEKQIHAEDQINALYEKRSNSQSCTGSKNCRSSNGHVIFSFSVPESCHTQTAKDHVKSWFCAWQSSVPWYSLFSDVWIEEEPVQPKAVCL